MGLLVTHSGPLLFLSSYFYSHFSIPIAHLLYLIIFPSQKIYNIVNVPYIDLCCFYICKYHYLYINLKHQLGKNNYFQKEIARNVSRKDVLEIRHISLLGFSFCQHSLSSQEDTENRRARRMTCDCLWFQLNEHTSKFFLDRPSKSFANILRS